MKSVKLIVMSTDLLILLKPIYKFVRDNIKFQIKSMSSTVIKLQYLAMRNYYELFTGI